MKWREALFASGVIALALTLLYQFVSSGGTGYFRKVDWELVNGMPYKDAQQYLLERSKTLTRWDSLRNAIYYWNFWATVIVQFAFLWCVGLGSCWLYEKTARRHLTSR